MAQRKRYEVMGMMEWHPEFRVGRGRLQVSFTGGHLCGGASTPASYETSDPVVQKVIESSAAYRSGRIHAHTLAPEGAHQVAPSGAAVRMTALHNPTVMEFDDLDRASDFLQEKKGVAIDQVLTYDQCMGVAKSLGIELVIKERQKK